MFEKVETKISGAFILKPKVFKDERGLFYESWNELTFKDLNLDCNFVQDNCSRSVKNVLRGLHYQVGKSAQGKLVGVTFGTVFDVFVDLRINSPTYGKWDGYILSTEDYQKIWIPPGCAHGFYVLSDVAEFTYKCTNFYEPKNDRSLIWNDPTVCINWPFQTEIELLMSKKDKEALPFHECEKYE